MSGFRRLATRDHGARVQCVGIEEIAIGSEARVIPVRDMRPVDVVAAPINALTLTAGLVSCGT